MWFTIGDYTAGIIIGILTTLAVRLCVAPGMDMVLAMVLGMGVGMVVHLLIGFMLAPLLGAFEVMMPGSLIGMYGGMLFAMRDSMAHAWSPTGAAVLAGGVFGAVVVAGVKTYNRILHGPVLDTGE
jgi:hypothetical protein